MLHHRRLIGDLMNHESRRFLYLHLSNEGAKLFPQLQHVAPRFHGYGNPDRPLAVKVHLRIGRLGVAPLHHGNISQMKDSSPHPKRRRADGIQIVITPGDAQVHIVFFGINHRRRGDRVLLLYRLGHQSRRKAQLRQPFLLHLNVYRLRLFP